MGGMLEIMIPVIIVIAVLVGIFTIILFRTQKENIFGEGE